MNCGTGSVEVGGVVELGVRNDVDTDDDVVGADVGVFAASSPEHAARTTPAEPARKLRRVRRLLGGDMTRMLESLHDEDPPRRPMKISSDTTAVITGGGGGIGRGTALGLAERGARLVIADIDLATATDVAEEMSGKGAEAIAVQLDATDVESITVAADIAESRFGSIDIVANNVGVVHSRELLEATETEWSWVIELNLMSIVRSCAVFAPRIRAHGRGGHIVNTASMAGLWASKPEQVSGVQLGLYTTTKHAVLGYTETLRGELAPEGIGVSCLCPGMVDSNLMQTSMRHRPDRFGGAEEVAPSRGPNPYAMDQEDMGKFVVAGIEGNRTQILTHPGARRFVDERAATLADDFEFFAAVENGRDR